MSDPRRLLGRRSHVIKPTSDHVVKSRPRATADPTGSSSTVLVADAHTSATATPATSAVRPVTRSGAGGSFRLRVHFLSGRITRFGGCADSNPFVRSADGASH